MQVTFATNMSFASAFILSGVNCKGKKGEVI